MACKTFLAFTALFTVCWQGASVTPSFGRSVGGDDIEKQGLGGKPLQPCSTDGDKQKTGTSRDGSCAWDPSDTAYHAVCVKMSDTFLKQSAEKDKNDLSSVVQNGGHWCICAWAFASAVSRDPENLEGLELVCDATNGKLRHVYKTKEKLQGPGENSYLTQNALKKVDELCGSASTDASKPEAAEKSSSFAPGALTFLFLSFSIHVFSAASSKHLES